jgi:hypothetical protein
MRRTPSRTSTAIFSKRKRMVCTCAFLDGVRLKLELVDEHLFSNDVVFLRYVVRD